MSELVISWLFEGWSLGSTSRDNGSSFPPRVDAARDTRVDASSPVAIQTSAHIGGLLSSELLTRLRHGDRDAFSHLYLALRTPLWRLATILTRSPDLAEDLVQNVFLSVWTRREQFSPDDDIQAYLRQAVRNASRQMLRHARVVLTHMTDAQQQDESQDPVSASVPSFEDRTERDAFLAAYQNALIALTERQRIALQLRLEEEMTFESIGSLMGISKVAARKLVLAAEVKVRELLINYRP